MKCGIHSDTPSDHVTGCFHYASAGHVAGFNCVVDCFQEVTFALDSEITCAVLQRATTCYDDNREACAANLTAFQLNFQLNAVRNKYVELDCAPTTEPMTAAPTQSPVSCPSVPVQVMGDPSLMTPTDIEPEGDISRECRVSGTGPVSHCR